jgi:hypothetical protein
MREKRGDLGMECALLLQRGMNRAPKIATLVAVMLAGVVVAAGAGARSRGLADASSCSHAAGAVRLGPVHAPGEDSLAEPPPPPPDEIEVQQGVAPAPDVVDWGNPYDLMLHKIPWGKTLDMR